MGNNRKMYRGNAAFIEMGARDIPLRILANVEHITSINFSQEIAEGADGEPEITGFKVVIGIAGQANEFMFRKPEDAVTMYNNLLSQIQNIGVITSAISRMKIVQPKASANGSNLMDLKGRPLQSAPANDDDDATPGIDDLEPVEELLEAVDEMEPAAAEPKQH